MTSASIAYPEETWERGEIFFEAPPKTFSYGVACNGSPGCLVKITMISPIAGLQNQKLTTIGERNLNSMGPIQNEEANKKGTNND